MVVFTTLGCKNNNNDTSNFDSEGQELVLESIDSIPPDNHLCALEDSLKYWGLIDIQSLDSSFFVDLRYANTFNFTKTKLYDCLDKAFLHPIPAEKLLKAQKILKEIDSTLSLLIWDAVRPIHVQQKMWDAVSMPISEKSKYISNPKNHSVHNYGFAVDLTICDSLGIPIDMGTDFDHFGIEARATRLQELIDLGLISYKQRDNRLLLQKVMNYAGFTILPSEWWHFNYGNRDSLKLKYQPIP